MPALAGRAGGRIGDLGKRAVVRLVQVCQGLP